jgi:TctA family transporter
VRLARLFRDLWLEFRRVASGATDKHQRLRKRVMTALVATLVVDLIGTAIMFSLEHGNKASEIDSPFEGFFWVSTQLLTVSSQMKNPVTTGGRITDIFLELWAISVVTALAGSFATFLQDKDRAEDTSA